MKLKHYCDQPLGGSMYEQSMFSLSAMLVAFSGITMCNAQADNPHCLIYHMIELVEWCVMVELLCPYRKVLITLYYI